MGGAPLAQGTIYLLFPKKKAHRLTAMLVAFISLAAVFVVLSPINEALVEPYRLSGRVLEWQWVRAFSPFINTYAVIFLVGGAAWSAWKYRREGASRRRMRAMTAGASCVLPQLPLVMMAVWSLKPRSARCSNVPAATNSMSSACENTARIVFVFARVSALIKL